MSYSSSTSSYSDDTDTPSISRSAQRNSLVYKRLSTLPGKNLKKALTDIKDGKLGTPNTTAHFKEDIRDRSNPANTHVVMLDKEHCSFDGVFWIDSEQQLERTFSIIRKEHVISFDLEGVEMGKQGEVALVQVALMNGTVFLFDVLTLGQRVFAAGLKDILESNTFLKVVHDCRRDSEILYHRHQVSLNHVFDLQVAHALLQKKREGNVPIRRYGLQELTHMYIPKHASQRAVDIKYQVRDIFKEGNTEVWRQRPLSKLMIDYSALDVIVLHPIYNSIAPHLQSPFDKRYLRKHFSEQLTYFKDSIKPLYSRNLI
ncbi:hypothetical protein SAMD00019534_098980 [Acytostelium subglobosum LB1]|uniref:hypothetical protein n=1 Tax=Acytostelium subglobosum LB1 TaxID=1410327 RepID=UPI00064502C1|nr:hypothetical protein SAMD00019534_098980 [Acytostelium subglobosum LB1]GAM26723.1 hypothetical protein SAMD00019534_098980 [Acytostelium subglobosum LB1]|eukprot:XP_012750384.1 hypothetical protein SAMD00019534_098980 [Acytostelium subglobosum LB1]